MTTTVDLAEFAAPKRDRWGRPLIVPPGGGKPKAYTRVSTLAKTLDDQSGLMKWMQRQAVKGVAKRADLIALAQSAGEDNQTLNEVVKQAMDAAESSSAANKGTALHSFTEAVDLGHDIDVPLDYLPDIQAYKKATAVLRVVMAEKFVVNDYLEAAGSFDRLVELPDGRMVMADIKTGKDAARYAVATAAQVAIYANSMLYAVATDTRTAFPDALDTSMGLLIHLPAGKGECHIHKLDLTFGYQFATAAAEVRDWRKTKPATLARSATA